MLQLGQIVKDRRGQWAEREIGPTRAGQDLTHG